MTRRAILLFLFVILLCASPAVPTAAQETSTCAALVATALQTVGDSCENLGRNEACYGNNHIDATFWEARDDLQFSFPGNRVPLIDLRTVATSPLDLPNRLWGVAAIQLHAANLPETLPGQAVTFLVMGSSRLENAVPPDEAALPVSPVEGRTAVETDLLGAPAPTGNSQGHLPAGTRVQLVGVDDTGGWAEVLLTGGERAWISGGHLEVDPAELAALPITYGPNIAPRYGPMQAFYFTTGLGELACREAPDALLVQSPQQFEVTLSVNLLEIQIGSTVLLTLIPAPGGTGAAMVLVLLEGELHFTLNGEDIDLAEPGQAAAITLNGQGRVDGSSELIDGSGSDITAILQNACQNALLADLFEQPFYAEACSVEVVFPYSPPPIVPPVYIPPPYPTITPTPPATEEPVSPTETACQWPVILYPPSGTNLTGGGGHSVNFSAVPNAASYQWFIQGDQHDYFASGTTTTTSFTFSVGGLPSGRSGLGYWIWAGPLDADGNPLCPPGRSPNAIWVSKDLGGPPPPETPICGNRVCDFGETPNTCPIDCGGPYCGNAACDPGEDPYNCPADCP